jgi:hypothetical protein
MLDSFIHFMSDCVHSKVMKTLFKYLNKIRRLTVFNEWSLCGSVLHDKGSERKGKPNLLDESNQAPEIIKPRHKVALCL